MQRTGSQGLPINSSEPDCLSHQSVAAADFTLLDVLSTAQELDMQGIEGLCMPP